MADNSLKISYKIYLEAEDISQSRISYTASYVSNPIYRKRKWTMRATWMILRFVCILTKR